MELIRGAHNLKDKHRGCVATIGNFDGVHLGHHHIIDRLAEVSKELNLPSLVITFEPHPREYFAKKNAPARLMKLREKLMVLNELDVDRVLVLFFNESLANKSAEDFIRDILVNLLGVRHLIVGHDFRFGHDRQGDFELLNKLAPQSGFEVEEIKPVNFQGDRISSNRIRLMLAEGNLDLAAQLLGRPYSMYGRVVHGAKKGQDLGFPTANIYLHRHLSPVLGVYTVRMHGIADKPICGVANVGNRPTIDGTRTLLEVHLLDFNQDIYGRNVLVEFVHKLRDEERYESLDLLIVQIGKDVENAKEFFKSEM